MVMSLFILFQNHLYKCDITKVGAITFIYMYMTWKVYVHTMLHVYIGQFAGGITSLLPWITLSLMLLPIEPSSWLPF